MKFVTIPMIARQVGRTPQAVSRAAKLAGVQIERPAGVKGGRIPVKAADDFIGRQWPEAPTFKDAAK